MWLLLNLPESKADHLIQLITDNFCMWYELDCVLETVNSDKGLGARLSCVH